MVIMLQYHQRHLTTAQCTSFAAFQRNLHV